MRLSELHIYILHIYVLHIHILHICMLQLNITSMQRVQWDKIYHCMHSFTCVSRYVSTQNTCNMSACIYTYHFMDIIHWLKFIPSWPLADLKIANDRKILHSFALPCQVDLGQHTVDLCAMVQMTKGDPLLRRRWTLHVTTLPTHTHVTTPLHSITHYHKLGLRH